MKKFIIAVTIFTILFCAGCAKTKEEATKAEATTSAPESTTAESTTAETTVIETTVESTTTETTTVSATTDSGNKKPHIAPAKIMENRSILSPELQKIYDEFLEKINNYETFIVDLSEESYSFDEFHKVCDAILDDFPETRLFLFTDESIREETYNGKPRFISVSYQYNWLMEESFSPEYMDNYLGQMNDVCDEIISRMPYGLSKAEQYEFLCREICERTTYVDKTYLEIPDWTWCYMNGPLLDGEGVCQAYAYAYQYLCHRAGLWCVTVSGGNHCWNLVQLENGATYHVDPTWIDEAFDFYDYFLLTQEEIERDHSPEKDSWVATGT